ncbi:AfsR/SARP family transcriptional regulator [Saccharothrix algeriensis]|uniref:DNA-binding SARP family transcriptional activator n=1 Tax=Saccharothrix algeriensis TaxID=173560 RepID=A0ABS2SFK5_9PSEU|nr:AfsR/SARP family transcriptional regulator [Saccharothrix algeriensis]MBM7815042.1 DNA-binding SARP family transcriptional activator [Saccharothrix algeriensis]
MTTGGVAAPPLRVALLGPVRAWSGEQEVALGSSRQRGVFAVLALRPGAVVRRDELIRAVWGQDAPATAEGSVYTYVSVLRKALEPGRRRGAASRLLESVGPGYRLVLDPAASDVAGFEALRRRARRQLDAGEPQAALRSLDEALALWRGVPLTGLEGPFARAQRLRLGEARAAARELRAEAALAAGAHLDVIGELGALISEEPLRERPRELLMSALHRAGRSAEALEVFREARQVLRAELAVEPGPGLRAAHERVLRAAPPGHGSGVEHDASRSAGGAGRSTGDAARSAGSATRSAGSATWSADDATRRADDTTRSASDATRSADDATRPAGGAADDVAGGAAGSARSGRDAGAGSGGAAGSALLGRGAEPAAAPGPDLTTPDHTTPDHTTPDPVAAGPVPSGRNAERAAAHGPVGAAEPVLLGRDAELAAVHGLVEDVRAGRGRTLWVQGEPGIGKSSLLGATTARAEALGLRVAHDAADELGTRFPLRTALRSLGVDPRSSDPRCAEIARELRDPHATTGYAPATGDPHAQAVDRLVGLVGRLCADGPLLLALDDLQWADEDSAELWRRLAAATDRWPLLLIGATRPVPHRADVARLRREVESGGGVVLDLAPLPDAAVAGIVAAVVGGEPGPGLRRIAARAGGNPLYARELADALVREEVVRFDAGSADVAADVLDRTPLSLVSAVADRLGFLSERTREVLRAAALLGGEFPVGDLSVVVGRPVPALLPAVTEAMAAGVLRDAGPRMAFRHPLIRQALYEGTPAADRAALHRRAARALAAADAPVEHVASQLLAAEDGLDRWVAGWLEERGAALVRRAPLVAVDLLRRSLPPGRDDRDDLDDDRDDDRDEPDEDRRDERDAVLAAHLSRALFRIGHDAEAEEAARRALPRLRDPDLVAEARWTLAYVPYRASRPHAALEALHEALADPAPTGAWRARLLSLLALVQRAGTGDLDAAAASARRAVEEGGRAGDPFAVGQALEVLWQVDAVQRDYVRALGHLDRALDVVGTDPRLTDLRLVLLDNRVFTLQCLDRLEEATGALRLAFSVAGPGTPVAGLHVAAAVHQFWLGEWDEAVARLDALLDDDPRFTGFGLREGGPVLLLHGVAALIAAHRDDAPRLRAHLAAGAELPLAAAADRENCDFLVAARAAAAVRQGDPEGAVALLGAILDTRYAQMMLRHQWLPELVRLALELGDRATARNAVAACEAEAARETSVARAAAAARRCRCLLDADPDGLLEVAGHYRAVGRTFELAQTLEDRAVLLDRRGEPAAGVLHEAVGLYRGLGAVWDVRRAATRLG